MIHCIKRFLVIILLLGIALMGAVSQENEEKVNQGIQDSQRKDSVFELHYSRSYRIGSQSNWMAPINSLLTPELSASVPGLELRLGWAHVPDYQNFDLYPGGCWSVEVLFAPRIGIWRPGIGAGFMYAKHAEWYIDLDPSFMSIPIVLVPLRFELGSVIRLPEPLCLNISVCEIRTSLLFPYGNPSWNDTGAFHLGIDIIKLGFGIMF